MMDSLKEIGENAGGCKVGQLGRLRPGPGTDPQGRGIGRFATPGNWDVCGPAPGPTRQGRGIGRFAARRPRPSRGCSAAAVGSHRKPSVPLERSGAEGPPCRRASRFGQAGTARAPPPWAWLQPRAIGRFASRPRPGRERARFRQVSGGVILEGRYFPPRPGRVRRLGGKGFAIIKQERGRALRARPRAAAAPF